jgi:hypothetical protein
VQLEAQELVCVRAACAQLRAAVTRQRQDTYKQCLQAVAYKQKKTKVFFFTLWRGHAAHVAPMSRQAK